MPTRRKHGQVAEFDPRQLDQLEDALEGLDEIDDLGELELSPELTERLGEYRDVLALCRNAFPSEAPGDDLLANVIAEAREVSRRPKLREGLASGSGWRRFWERWRTTIVPGLALAGTAAAVLFLLEPGEGFDKTATLTAERSDERENDSADRDTAESSQPAKQQEIDEPETEPEPAIDEGGAVDVGPKPQVKMRKKSKVAAPEPAPAPAPAPMSKDDTWFNLERANQARRAGNCDDARALYEEILAASSDTTAKSRAQAGIGLCFEQDRNESEAQAWFDEARATHKGVDTWIETQRDKQPRPGEKKKQHSKKSAELPSPVEGL